MSSRHIAFVFPAFTSDYSDHPGNILPGFDAAFRIFLIRAARQIDPSLSTFDFTCNIFSGDELRTQYITYIYSCAASAVLREEGVVPSVVAGYSMGIYAALQDAGVITFEAGLELIFQAYESLRSTLFGSNGGMGSVIGLDRVDIERLISDGNLDVWITNQNAGHSFVVSGMKSDLAQLLQNAREEGALNTRDLGASTAYHSPALKEGALVFEQRIRHINMASPAIPVISLIDQRLLSDHEQLRQEVVRNLFQPLNWSLTSQSMLEYGIELLIECGPSRGLARNARFLPGNYRFHALDSALSCTR